MPLSSIVRYLVVFATSPGGKVPQQKQGLNKVAIQPFPIPPLASKLFWVRKVMGGLGGRKSLSLGVAGWSKISQKCYTKPANAAEEAERAPSKSIR
eukprot:5906001-Amphidinium_carterae.1